MFLAEQNIHNLLRSEIIANMYTLNMNLDFIWQHTS